MCLWRVFIGCMGSLVVEFAWLANWGVLVCVGCGSSAGGGDILSTIA